MITLISYFGITCISILVYATINTAWIVIHTAAMHIIFIRALVYICISFLLVKSVYLLYFFYLFFICLICVIIFLFIFIFLIRFCVEK